MNFEQNDCFHVSSHRSRFVNYMRYCCSRRANGMSFFHHINFRMLFWFFSAVDAVFVRFLRLACIKSSTRSEIYVIPVQFLFFLFFVPRSLSLSVCWCFFAITFQKYVLSKPNCLYMFSAHFLFRIGKSFMQTKPSFNFDETDREIRCKLNKVLSKCMSFSLVSFCFQHSILIRCFCNAWSCAGIIQQKMEIGPESVTEYEEGIANAMENVRNHDSHYLLLCASNDVTSLLSTKL